MAGNRSGCPYGLGAEAKANARGCGCREPILHVIGKYLSEAAYILDRFHIVKLLKEVVDQVRRQEIERLRRHGVDLLRDLKYVFRKRPEHPRERQQVSLHGVLNKSWLCLVRAYLWREKFDLFGQSDSPYWARRYLRKWCEGAKRSRLAPIKNFLGTILAQEELFMDCFKSKKQSTGGAVEGMNKKVNRQKSLRLSKV